RYPADRKGRRSSPAETRASCCRRAADRYEGTIDPLLQREYRWPKSLWADFAMDTALLVSVVDDDESVRESLPDLLRQLGFGAQAFSSAEAFLASGAASETRCLIVDIAMPGMSGPDLQAELKRRRIEIPIVFITARGDENDRRHLLACGAIECLF